MELTLRDGTPIVIRPVEPEDRRLIAEGFERLSPESRYRRFFGPMPRLTQRDLDYLTRVDHHDHEALIAVEPESGRGLGVARYVRIAPDEAEPAMVVVDDWQGRGVGSRLLDRLVARAREEGVERFQAPVLAGNHEAIRVLERLGETTKRSEGREVMLTIELPAEPVATGGWPDLLRQFAVGALEPARSVVELLWPRRRGAPGDPRRNVVVVGTDGSEHARAAVEVAGGIAEALGARVEVIGAHSFLPTSQGDARDAVSAAAAQLRERGLHVHEQVRRGDPALALPDAADECDARLIVVGAGDRGKTARRIMGSVADFVAERAPCNVLVVRP